MVEVADDGQQVRPRIERLLQCGACDEIVGEVRQHGDVHRGDDVAHRVERVGAGPTLDAGVRIRRAYPVGVSRVGQESRQHEARGVVGSQERRRDRRGRDRVAVRRPVADANRLVRRRAHPHGCLPRRHGLHHRPLRHVGMGEGGDQGERRHCRPSQGGRVATAREGRPVDARAGRRVQWRGMEVDGRHDGSPSLEMNDLCTEAHLRPRLARRDARPVRDTVRLGPFREIAPCTAPHRSARAMRCGCAGATRQRMSASACRMRLIRHGRKR